ncbi:MAG: GntR family transcriptional regulator [Clostridia bacterium]|nr:GntR family transcriptional regulator [Clostridia bacterium]
MLQLDFKSGVPICDQIVNGFIRLKALGVLKGGDQLPSVRALASRLAVNPNTVQKAYAMLESSGIIYSVKGKGSFLSDDDQAHNAVKQSAINAFRSAVLAARELGLEPTELKNIIDEVSKEGGKAND